MTPSHSGMGFSFLKSLPPGGHPKVVSLAPLGQFTSRCPRRGRMRDGVQLQVQNAKRKVQNFRCHCEGAKHPWQSPAKKPRHCEGIYARGNPFPAVHNTAPPLAADITDSHGLPCKPRNDGLSIDTKAFACNFLRRLGNTECIFILREDICRGK